MHAREFGFAASESRRRRCDDAPNECTYSASQINANQSQEEDEKKIKMKIEKFANNGTKYTSRSDVNDDDDDGGGGGSGGEDVLMHSIDWIRHLVEHNLLYHFIFELNCTLLPALALCSSRALDSYFIRFGTSTALFGRLCCVHRMPQRISGRTSRIESMTRCVCLCARA